MAKKKNEVCIPLSYLVAPMFAVEKFLKGWCIKGYTLILREDKELKTQVEGKEDATNKQFILSYNPDMFNK